jgi:hypothetical protein
MVAYFNLTSEDIRTIDFRDSYFVDCAYYRLNKIMDYNPIGNTLTKVELIKIRDAVFIPSDSFSHGDVDLTNVGVGTPPYASSGLSQGAVIVGDTSGLASESEAATTLGDIFVYSGSQLVRLPIGSNGKVLTVDTSDPTRSMSWTTPSGGGTPGGANKQVQYNDSGAFGAEAGFEYDKTTNELTVPDIIDSSLTASELIASNGSKKLVSLAVATYPSLTELSYVKGVTSAIQTQINAKLSTTLATGQIFLGVGGVATASSNPRAILNEEQVIQIRKMYKEKNMTIIEICKLFNVGWSAISNIVKYKSWRHLNG